MKLNEGKPTNVTLIGLAVFAMIIFVIAEKTASPERQPFYDKKLQAAKTALLAAQAIKEYSRVLGIPIDVQNDDIPVLAAHMLKRFLCTFCFAKGHSGKYFPQSFFKSPAKDGVIVNDQDSHCESFHAGPSAGGGSAVSRWFRLLEFLQSSSLR